MAFTHDRIRKFQNLIDDKDAMEIDAIRLIAATYPNYLQGNPYYYENILDWILHYRTLKEVAESIGLMYFYEIGGARRSLHPEIQALAHTQCFKFESEPAIISRMLTDPEQIANHLKFGGDITDTSANSIYHYTWHLLATATEIDPRKYPYRQVPLWGFETDLLDASLEKLYQSLNDRLGGDYNMFEFFMGML